ncbi:MAG: LptF/LptG family permease [Phycisphaerae bacterium]|nr:LptF/LptG family permease [Phycisphaerae bacterium]
MLLLDRHIAIRYLTNFVLLFAILYLFAVSIDVILQLDNFSDAARDAAAKALAVEKDAVPFVSYAIHLGHAIFDYWGPRIAQFFAYMLGLVSVGAAGFTLTQMLRTRELVAIMAAGTSLIRVAMVIIAVATGLNLLQLVNQELVLPRLAPLLVRGHDDVLKGGLSEFPVPLTRDARGQLLRIRSINPMEGVAHGVLLIERDGNGAAIARVEAEVARWNPDLVRYDMDQGTRSTGRTLDANGTTVSEGTTAAAAFVSTDLSPRALTIRRYAQYAQMLSLRQLREMREEGGVDPGMLSRLTYLRLGSILVNILVLIAAIPFFLLREPANLLRQSILCAAFAVPGTLGSLVAMTVDLPGLPPAVSVFLPAAVLLPIAMGRLGMVKT